MIGDVIIAPAYVKRQASEFEVEFDDEMALMVTHGILHLMGYDHQADGDASAMESRETETARLWWGRSGDECRWSWSWRWSAWCWPLGCVPQGPRSPGFPGPMRLRDSVRARLGGGHCGRVARGARADQSGGQRRRRRPPGDFRSSGHRPGGVGCRPRQRPLAIGLAVGIRSSSSETRSPARSGVTGPGRSPIGRRPCSAVAMRLGGWANDLLPEPELGGLGPRADVGIGARPRSRSES